LDSTDILLEESVVAVNPSIVDTSSLTQAANGNVALLTILNKLATAANTQATQTNTSGKNPPNQSSAVISFQNPLYIVTITDPGGAAALSPSQAAARAAATTLGGNPTLSTIFHQVQAATSTLFDVPAGLMTYGGDNGNLQTQFIIAGLDTKKSWYFRIRTSYDGNNWNTWRLINPQATSVNVNAVRVEPIAGGNFAGITTLGEQVFGFGVGHLPNNGMLQSGGGTLIADTFGILGPSGYVDAGYEPTGLLHATINSLGVVSLDYVNHTGTDVWPGDANFLTFGWQAHGAQKPVEQVMADGGRWVVLTLPGGSRVAFGSGVIATGASFAIPAGFTAANSMGVCSPNAVIPNAPNPAYGVYQATVVNSAVTLTWADSTGHFWGGTANWFAVAWEPALSANLVTVGGGQYLKIPTLSGPVMIGVGQGQSGSIMPLPPGGYKYSKCLAFSTPATFDNFLQYAMHGVQLVSIDAGSIVSVGTITCLYGTITGMRTGAAAWFSIAWL
jgi:hypothetical protein